jgi:RHS repeat-associated protein
VRPVASYTYDATYRLIEATGREHIGQTTHAADPPDGNRRDRDLAGLADFAVHPNDLDALRTYTQTYEYDGVGNLHSVRHGANSGSWTRSYDYAAASLLEPTKQNNRLTRTAIGNGASSSETYSYNDVQGHDVNGCMTSINAMGLAWDFKDQLHQVALGGGGTAYYLYDASGQRVRKVLEDQNGAPRAERIYLGGYEVYRTFGADATERETLHVMDDRQRFAIVETQTAPSADTPVLRYQLGNHLGSVAMELDAGGALISYEEYHPYGTSAFQAGRSLAEVSLKRYRYTGKERDEETGFSYHSARFYSPWLARWTSCDPLGLVEGTNAFVYARCNPLNSTDTSGTQCQPAVQSCAPPSGAADYNTFEEWVRNAPSPLSDAGVVEAWRAAHPDQIVNPQFSTANASTQLSSTDSADAAAGYRLPQTAGSSAVTVWDTAQRARYLEAIHNRSLSAVAEVEAARAAGDLEAAERSARAASAFRNTIRSETQEFLSPGGRLMSQALEGERSWTTMFNRYGGTHSFETYSEIAAASGRSSRLVTGLSTFGRYAGPIGVAVGVGVAGYEVSNAPPGEAPRVAVREAGGMVGGAAGATGGTALGTGTAMVVAGLLGLEGPPGWLVLVLGGAGGLAGGYGGSEGGRAGAGALYDAAVDESAAAYQEAERGIYQLYGVPHF